jgi:hypothetical protein
MHFACHVAVLTLLSGFLVACEQQRPQAGSGDGGWVIVAKLSGEDAYSFQFKLNSNAIPHKFEQVDEFYLVRVPATEQAKARELVTAQKFRDGTVIPIPARKK